MNSHVHDTLLLNDLCILLLTAEVAEKAEL